MTDENDDILSRLPTRLKEARRAQGLSLDAVAKLSGVSRSMVSQIERGESSPTIATLWNLTRALQVDFAGLLAGQTDGIDVLRAAEAPTIDNRGSRCRLRILSPPEDAGRCEVYEISLGDGGTLDSQPHTAGAREQITVITGRIEVISGASREILRTGDSARYAADIPHGIHAIGGGSRAILIVQDA